MASGYRRDPDDPEAFRWLRTWSPLHAVRPGVRYPPTLVTTGDTDDRVVPAHSFKYAAAMQYAQAGDAPTVLVADCDPAEVDRIRAAIPALEHRRLPSPGEP